MHVAIKIVAKDYERGKQATREDEIEVPPKTAKLFEMFSGNDPDQLLRWVADTLFGSAYREVTGGGKRGDVKSAMAEVGGGRIGGRGAPGENKQADVLAETLGLDVIRADVAKQRGQAPAAPPQQVHPQGPGPIGFGGGQHQPQIGPGPIGYSGDRPINPGPGPGPIGFGPDRSK